MSGELRHAIARAVKEPISDLTPIAGGDINEAYAATLASGEKVFVKTHHDAPLNMYAREAEGLSWLAEARALHTPDVLAVRQELLVLKWIDRGQPARDFDEQLGRGLAHLHRAGAPCFGHTADNYIGNLPQENTPQADWCDFYRLLRLAPLIRASDRLLDASAKAAFERLFVRLRELVGPREPPARLHGDLWSGNVYVDARGQPVLIDPAVYGGHREMDLAMLQLFGAPSARLFAAYNEVYPLAPGFEERVPLYQLYPLLVHVRLFGAGYVPQLRRALSRYV